MPFPDNSTILDAFDRANADPLDGSWTLAWYGDAANEPKLVSNAVKCSQSGVWAGFRYNAATYGPDCDMFISAPTWSDVLKIYARVGGTDASPNGYGCRISSGASDSNIFVLTGGSESVLGAAFTVTPHSGDKFGIKVTGTTNPVIELWQYTSGAWSQVTTRTDTNSTYQGAGYFAVEVYAATLIVDDFGGGTISGAPADLNVAIVPSDATYQRNTVKIVG